MKQRSCPVVAAAGLAVACSSPALAQSRAVATHTDAADPVAGAIVVRGLPASGASGGSDERGGIAQLPGFPITIGRHPNFVPWRGPALVDLDGDGDLELLQSSTEGRLYAWHHDATPVAGFPVATTGFPQYPPAVADMDGDGDPEIVLHTRGLTSGGRLYVLDHTGAVLPGFPLSFSNENVESSPALFDLDGDGQLEILSTVRDYPIGYLHVVELDGSTWGGNWPVTLSHVPTGTVAVADVDVDGEAEIFCMSYDRMYLLKPDGTAEAGWPRGISGANFSYQSAALADLDGDEDLEIALAAHQSAAGAYVFHHDGSLASGWPFLFDTWSYCAPTVTDLEGDGALEVIAGQAGIFFGESDCFWVWDADGDTRPGFPYRQLSHGGGSEGPLTVADIDGDGVMEIFADHNVMEADQGYLFGVDAAGNDLPGFPLRPRGFTYLNSATIADVDGNGTYELGVTSYSDGSVDVNLYTLPTSYSSTGREWPTYHSRYTRDGLFAPGSECYADFNADGAVDTRDVIAFLNAWNAQNAGADCDGNGLIDTRDVICFLNAWNEGCP
ncbi:MAG TPA: VCBS repeat-containing protein [Phycisphaerales bacterium]|nr:VCBS repeat-containing protein [Phycisphaerales bacterium]